MEINGMEIQIKKNWYNRTRVQPDGITHITDPQQYTVYQFGMAKNYFLEDRNDVIDELVKDLREIATHLEQMKAQELGKNENER